MTRPTILLPASLIAVAMLVACTVAIVALTEQKAEAAFPGNNGRIAFYRQSVEGTRTDIFTVNPDGSGRRNVTNTVRADETYPSFSADGKKLVFARKSRYNPPTREIVTLHLPSGSERTVAETPFFEFSGPSWSPDGRKIVFVARAQDGSAEIFTVNRDGSGRRQLTDSAEGPSDPAYSPDGTRIAFARSGPDGTRIWTMEADGTNKKKLTSAPPDGSGGDVEPDWSPGGKEIAFIRYRGGLYSHDIYAVRSDGTGLRKITKTPNADEYEPAYSPDGNRIVYERYDPRDGHDIWKVPATGGSGVPVTDTPDYLGEAPSWGPKPPSTN